MADTEAPAVPSFYIHKLTRTEPTAEQKFSRTPVGKRAARLKKECEDIAGTSGHQQPWEFTPSELERLLNVELGEVTHETLGLCTRCKTLPGAWGKETVVYDIRGLIRVEDQQFCAKCIDELWDDHTEVISYDTVIAHDAKSGSSQLLCEFCLETAQDQACLVPFCPLKPGLELRQEDKELLEPRWEDIDYRYAVESKVWCLFHKDCREVIRLANRDRLEEEARVDELRKAKEKLASLGGIGKPQMRRKLEKKIKGLEARDPRLLASKTPGEEIPSPPVAEQPASSMIASPCVEAAAARCEEAVEEVKPQEEPYPEAEVDKYEEPYAEAELYQVEEPHLEEEEVKPAEDEESYSAAEPAVVEEAYEYLVVETESAVAEVPCEAPSSACDQPGTLEEQNEPPCEPTSLATMSKPKKNKKAKKEKPAKKTKHTKKKKASFSETIVELPVEEALVEMVVEPTTAELEPAVEPELVVESAVETAFEPDAESESATELVQESDHACNESEWSDAVRILTPEPTITEAADDDTPNSPNSPCEAVREAAASQHIRLTGPLANLKFLITALQESHKKQAQKIEELERRLEDGDDDKFRALEKLERRVVLAEGALRRHDGIFEDFQRAFGEM